jgi:hypothetical protein
LLQDQNGVNIPEDGILPSISYSDYRDMAVVFYVWKIEIANYHFFRVMVAYDPVIPVFIAFCLGTELKSGHAVA